MESSVHRGALHTCVQCLATRTPPKFLHAAPCTGHEHAFWVLVSLGGFSLPELDKGIPTVERQFPWVSGQAGAELGQGCVPSVVSTHLLETIP